MRNNKITFIRNENGEWVKKTVGAVKYVGMAAIDVIRVYADLLRGLLDLSIRIGLFVFFYPYIAQFIRFFIETAKTIGGGMG